MRTPVTRLALSGALLLGATSVTLAGPFDPAYRGDPNSVHAIFDWVGFGVGDWSLSLFETGPSTYPLDPTMPEAFDDGTNATIIFPNFIDPLPIKYVRLQLFFDGPVPGEEIGYFVVGHDPEGAVAVETFRTVGPATEHYVDFEIRPNPDWEEIFITGSTPFNIIPGNLLRLEIDTVSVPSPGAFLALGVGAAPLAARRRRR